MNKDEKRTIQLWSQIAVFAKRYPWISWKDHLLIVETARGTDHPYMSKKGLNDWYETNARAIDDSVIQEIRGDPHRFMYTQSHQVPDMEPELRDRNRLTFEANSFKERFGIYPMYFPKDFMITEEELATLEA